MANYDNSFNIIFTETKLIIAFHMITPLSMDTKPWKRATIILSVIIVIVLVVPSFLWLSQPAISVKDCTNSVLYNGSIGSSLNNTSFNRTWANGTIIQKSAPESYFNLTVGPGSVYKSWSDTMAGWTARESPVLTFEGVLTGDLHPTSVTLSISTNGSNGGSEIQMEGSSYASVNVSYSDQNMMQLSFRGNGSVSSTFGLRNVPVILFSPSTHIYKFSYATAFQIESILESSFVRSATFTVTLNGLSTPVSDSVLVEISHGSE